jgi:hypothetical protein
MPAHLGFDIISVPQFATKLVGSVGRSLNCHHVQIRRIQHGDIRLVLNPGGVGPVLSHVRCRVRGHCLSINDGSHQCHLLKIWMGSASGIYHPHINTSPSRCACDVDIHLIVPPSGAPGLRFGYRQAIDRTARRGRIGKHDPKSRRRNWFDKRDDMVGGYADFRSALLVRRRVRNPGLITCVPQVEHDFDTA